MDSSISSRSTPDASATRSDGDSPEVVGEKGDPAAVTPRDTMARVYAWPSFGISVKTEEPAHLDWLDEFLQPSFCASLSGSADLSVRVVQDTSRFRGALSAGKAAEDLDAFVLDSRILKLPGWTTEQGRRALDDKYSVLYSVDQTGSQVEILQLASDLKVRNPLMRVVRELAMSRARRAGTLFLHAACVSLGGKGVIIAGPKRGGKSTLLAHAMRADSARYVGNDRVGVSWKDGTPELRGVPVIVCLRETALEFTPGLRRRLVDNRYRWELTLDECRGRPSSPPKPWLDGRYGITPTQFCALFGRPRASSVEPHAAVFPEITERPGSIRLARISEEETAARLRRSVFGIGHLGARSDLFDPEGRPESEDEVGKRCSELAHRIMGYRCELGTDVRHSKSTGEELESALGH